jgi:UPF0755 protein
MSALKKIVLALVALVLAGFIAVCLIALKFMQEPASDSSDVVVFDVRPGESFKSVSRRLGEEGLVTSTSKLDLYARLTGFGSKVRVGEYAIRRDLRPRDVVNILVSGKSIEYTVTATEGSNRFEIGDALEKQGIIKRADFLTLTGDAAVATEMIGYPVETLEGYLFPETYHITKFTGARGLVKMMVTRFKENFAKVKVSPNQTLRPHQLVTLASIVEKETGAPEERGVIASVFYNRLKMGMKLQTDPTVVYGIWEKTGAWNKNISRQDLLTPSRYNTYVITGLPFGPISNPGLEALKAAANPAQTEFLFFVSRNNGTHVFSKDYKQHQNAVTQFQLDRKAREGKSWRDLKTRTEKPADVIAAPPLQAPAGTKKK